MFVLSNFIIALAKVVDISLSIYTFIIIFRAVVSWVNADPHNAIVIFLYRVTEPVLRPVRRILPMHNLRIDFAPVIVVLILIFLQYFLVETITELARRL